MSIAKYFLMGVVVMGIWDWLASPSGLEFTHSVTILLVAMAGWLTWRTHRQTEKLDDKLNGHLHDHINMLLSEHEQTQHVPPSQPPP